jgi:hypothetical protein
LPSTPSLSKFSPDLSYHTIYPISLSPALLSFKKDIQVPITPPLFLPSSPYKSTRVFLLALSSTVVTGGLDLYSQFQYCGWIMRCPDQQEVDEVRNLLLLIIFIFISLF